MTEFLIVDDDPDIRYLIRRMLGRAEAAWSVAEAGSGTDAVEFCRDSPPDFVVLDQGMPGLNGIETAELILAEHPDQRVILFTAYGDAEIERRAAALGIRACVPKADFGRLIAVIRSHLGEGA